MKPLYHFTNSAHLPRIIRSGELRPPAFELPGQEHLPEFVHATSNPNGERTAAGWWHWQPTFDAGVIRRVRFTLHAEDFAPWREVYARSGWSPFDMISLERAALSRGSNTAKHFCRAEPLSLSRVIAVHTRSVKSKAWEPFDIASANVSELGPIKGDTFGPDVVDCLGIEIGGLWYTSERFKAEHGNSGYAFAPAPYKLEAVAS